MRPPRPETPRRSGETPVVKICAAESRRARARPFNLSPRHAALSSPQTIDWAAGEGRRAALFRSGLDERGPSGQSARRPFHRGAGSAGAAGGGEGEMNPQVDAYLSRAGKWRAEFAELRRIALGCGLAETLKWGEPCYTLDNKNIVLMHGFKEYCALLFFKGALLEDPAGVLIQQTANVQAGRQIRFTEVGAIVEMEAVLRAYIHQAIEVEKSGLRVQRKSTAEFAVPIELQTKLDAAADLKAAFAALTQGRQRAYILHFSAPKQSKTREARIEKCTPQILEGKGLND
jgi:uncharacterized protein YdeI (YjbR/CyaY-like superfamily)